MRFLMATKGDEDWASGKPPSPELEAAVGAFIGEMAQAGVFITGGGLSPRPLRVQSSGGQVTITDGPFTEAKEMLAGFAIVEVDSQEEAIDVATRFWAVIGDGEGEIWQIFA